jgi:hypothetical protein
MNNLEWFDLAPPRSLDLAAVTRLMRPLASRPRVGIMQRTPIAVFELWIEPGRVRWLLGVDDRLARWLPFELQAQVPRLGISKTEAPERPVPLVGADVRLSSFAFPLRSDTADAVSAGALATASLLHHGEVAVLQWLIGPSYQRAQRPERFNLSQALGLQQPTPPTAAENQAWRAKAAEPLFGTRGRIGAVAATQQRARSIIRAVAGALSLANSSHCALRTGTATVRRALDLAAVHRPAVTWSSVMSASELAQAVCWPLGDVAVPGRGTLLSPAPAALMKPPQAAGQLHGERVLGASLHPADRGQLVTMPLATSTHNVHITGPTGSGKSTELAQLIVADAEAGHGVLVIEPRGDLIQDVLRRLPTDRQADVVVIDPADEDQVGINLLAGPIQQAERRADELVGLFRALYGSALGPRSADVLFNSLLTAARLPDGTLADVPTLLANKSFRRRALAAVGDPLVVDRWWAWFDSTSPGEQAQITAPINNKLRAFLNRQPIRRMLGQSNPSFSFDEFFSARPLIVLVNLNRGVIGPEASRLLGSLLLSAIWSAAQRRATLPQAKRFPIMLTIDEFQDYVGALDFGEVLAECRGLSIGATIAHQHLKQLDPQLLADVTANARSRLAFRPSPNDVRPLADVFGKPVTPDDLVSLGAFQACGQLLVDNVVTAPFVLGTRPLGPATADPAKVGAASRTRYAASGAAVDESLIRRWHSGGDVPDTPIGERSRRSS